MVTFVPPGAAEALDDDDDDELALELALEELDDDSVFLSDEQPETPAIRIAAPPTATSNPRFTQCSFVSRPVKISGTSPAV